MIQKILIVEDDFSLATGLQELFTLQGYATVICDCIKDTMDALSKNHIDLCILDVHLGNENGFELCKSIRKDYDFPILFLTGCNSESELLTGFKAGCDDYLTKPFRMNELLARITALLRRYSPKINSQKTSGDITYFCDLEEFQKNGEPLMLTLTEYRLAECLFSNYPAIITRESLYFNVWDQYNSFVDANTLNVNMSRLREKLGSFNGVPYIQTVRGKGYRWNVAIN